jgi:hypothetical protein
MCMRTRSRLREQTTRPGAPNNKHKSNKYRHCYTAHQTPLSFSIGILWHFGRKSTPVP